MANEKLVHINVLKDGLLVKMPAEHVFELRDKVGKVSGDSDAGVGIAFARIWSSVPHWHDFTKEYYFVAEGVGQHLSGSARYVSNPATGWRCR